MASPLDLLDSLPGIFQDFDSDDEDDLKEGADGDAYANDFDDEEACEQKNGWPPTAQQWSTVGHDTNPSIRVNFARSKLLDQMVIEGNKIRSLFSSEANSKANTAIQEIADFLLGRRSDIFHAFEVSLKWDFNKYATFLATLFFAASLGMNYTKLYNNERVDCSNLMTPDEYNSCLHEIDEYAVNKLYQPRFWVLLENAYNLTMRSNFMPTRNEFKLLLGDDDDKIHYNWQKQRLIEFGTSSGLRHNHHTKDNVNGFTLLFWRRIPESFRD